MGHMRGPSHPIKKWRCDDCQWVFEERYSPQDKPIPECPECGSVNLHNIFKSPTGQTLDGVEPELVRVR